VLVEVLTLERRATSSRALAAASLNLATSSRVVDIRRNDGFPPVAALVATDVRELGAKALVDAAKSTDKQALIRSFMVAAVIFLE
jgi:hypothetical protein